MVGAPAWALWRRWAGAIGGMCRKSDAGRAERQEMARGRGECEEARGSADGSGQEKEEGGKMVDALL